MREIRASERAEFKIPPLHASGTVVQETPGAMPPKTRRPRESTKEWLARKLAEDREDEKLDWARAEKEDERDKRCVGAPCNGNHQVDRNGRIKNAHMVMYRCTRKDCGLRLLYVPSVGSHGNTRKATPLEYLREAEEPERISALPA